MRNRLKELRKKLNLTQEALADRLNLKSRSIIAYYENGKRSIPERTICDICEKFNVNRDWLENGIGDMFIKKSVTNSLLLPEQFEDLAALIGGAIVEKNEFRLQLLKLVLTLDECELDLFKNMIQKLK